MIGIQDEISTGRALGDEWRPKGRRIGGCSQYCSGIEIEIMADTDPCFLSRAFGLLATLDITPDYWFGTVLNDQTQLTFHFKTSNAKKTDLLVRKLNQLTLIRDVSIHEAKKAPSSADVEVPAFCARALTLVAVNICRIKLPPGDKTGYKFIGMPADLDGWARTTISGKTKRYG